MSECLIKYNVQDATHFHGCMCCLRLNISCEAMSLFCLINIRFPSRNRMSGCSRLSRLNVQSAVKSLPRTASFYLVVGSTSAMSSAQMIGSLFVAGKTSDGSCCVGKGNVLTHLDTMCSSYSNVTYFGSPDCFRRDARKQYFRFMFCTKK